MFKWSAKVLARHPNRPFPCLAEWQCRTQRATFDNSKAKRMLAWNPASDRAELIRLAVQVPADEVFA